MKPHGRRYWRNIILVSIIALLVGLAFAFYIALPNMYANGVAQPQRASVCCQTPADFGLDYENITFTSKDGITLHGWYLPSQNGAAIIVSHGIGGNRVGQLEKGIFLATQGFGVLLLDLRAHGESGGETVTFGGNDIIAAANYLQTLDEITSDKIGAWGISLGGLASLQAAAASQDIQAVAADGSAANEFRDLPRPVTIWQWLDLPFQWVTYFIWERKGVTAPISTADAVEKISPRPVLLIAGTKSEFEQAQMQKFFSAAREPKTLWEVPDAGHAENWAVRPDEYQTRVLAFFTQALLTKE
jgi:fermentation-respiration switch protein FrsA (DUF1100 family)